MEERNLCLNEEQDRIYFNVERGIFLIRFLKKKISNFKLTYSIIYYFNLYSYTLSNLMKL